MVLPKKLTHHKNDLSQKSYLWFSKRVKYDLFLFLTYQKCNLSTKNYVFVYKYSKKTKNCFHFCLCNITAWPCVYLFCKKTSNPYIYESWNWQLDVYIQAQSLNTFVTSMIKKDVMNILHWIFWCFTLPGLGGGGRANWPLLAIFYNSQNDKDNLFIFSDL